MNNSIIDRDEQLDIYRGLSMMYVICIIHVAYWLQLGEEPYLSIALFEMPVIFFISGAAQSLKPEKRDVLQTCWSRIKRVVIPYYIYASIVICSMIVMTWICDIISPYNNEIAEHFKYDLSSYTLKDIWYIVSFQKIPQAHFVWHLWFIIPYLLLSCTFDLQKRMIGLIGKFKYSLLCLTVFLIVQFLTDNLHIRNIFCYNLFLIIGYCFYKKVKRYIILIAGSLFCATFVVISKVVYGNLGGVIPLQSHKFPPDLFFILYGLTVICIMSLLFGRIKIPNCWILNLWNKRGYSLYLYQSFVFYLIMPLYSFILHFPFALLRIILCMILVFTLSTAISYITYPFERWIMKLLRIN